MMTGESGLEYDYGRRLQTMEGEIEVMRSDYLRNSQLSDMLSGWKREEDEKHIILNALKEAENYLQNVCRQKGYTAGLIFLCGLYSCRGRLDKAKCEETEREKTESEKAEYELAVCVDVFQTALDLQRLLFFSKSLHQVEGLSDLVPPEYERAVSSENEVALSGIVSGYIDYLVVLGFKKLREASGHLEGSVSGAVYRCVENWFADQMLGMYRELMCFSEGHNVEKYLAEMKTVWGKPLISAYHLGVQCGGGELDGALPDGEMSEYEFWLSWLRVGKALGDNSKVPTMIEKGKQRLEELRDGVEDRKIVWMLQKCDESIG